MNEELQLKLQAYADGELSAREARDIADLVAKDADVCALLTELKNTRAALAGFEAEIRLPESREFYWSKIEREIRQLEKADTPRPEAPLAAGWLRFLVPASALVALVALVLVGIRSSPQPRESHTAASEFALADSDGFTFHDYANGTTLVWLSYPAENEFTHIGSEDTLD